MKSWGGSTGVRLLQPFAKGRLVYSEPLYTAPLTTLDRNTFHRRQYSPSLILHTFKVKQGRLKKSQWKRLKGDEQETDLDEDGEEEEIEDDKHKDRQEIQKEKEKALKLQRDLEAMMSQLTPGQFWTHPHPPKVLVIHPYVKFVKGVPKAERDIPDLRLYEAIALVESMAWPVLDAKTISYSGKRHPRFFFGTGKFEEIKAELEEKKIDILYIDTEQLSPNQLRTISLELNCKVLDRFRLILEIFSQRAETIESKLQVELASIPYRRAHLSTLLEATSMSQQRSGGAFMTGAGETQLELEKRTLAETELKMKKDLEHIAKTRELHRSSRKNSSVPTFAIVGYTNAGKSALLNTLSGSTLGSHDMLFASLHTHVRKLLLPSGNTALGTDTVGFISNLPHRLVAPFRSTLEEIGSADIVVHVRDITNVETERQRKNVRQILDEVYDQYGRAADTELEVWNKVDLLDKKHLRRLKKINTEGAFLVSAKTGYGLKKLVRRMDEIFLEKYPNMRRVFKFIVPEDNNQQLLQFLYEHGRVTSIEANPSFKTKQEEQEENKQETNEGADEKGEQEGDKEKEETKQEETKAIDKEEEEEEALLKELMKEQLMKVTVQMTAHDCKKFLNAHGHLIKGMTPRLRVKKEEE